MRSLVSAALIATLVLAAGCASAPERSSWDPTKLVWPLPPDKPRVTYVGSLSSEFDVAPPSFADTVLAEAVPAVMTKPFGVTSDSAGRVYVSDIGRVFIFDKEKGKLSFFGQKGGISLVRPAGMFYDKVNQLLYVADSSLDMVVVYDGKGSPVLALGQNRELENPGGVVVDAQRNRVYVANTRKHVITVFSTEGKYLEDIGERGVAALMFNYPTQIAIDKEGNIYVVDTGNFRVQVISPEGKFVREFGSVGITFGQFSRPKGIAVDPWGNVHVVDAIHGGVTVFNREGQVLLPWGARGTDLGLFAIPAGIHIDENAKAYVVSQETRRVDIFQLISYPEDTEGAVGVQGETSQEKK